MLVNCPHCDAGFSVPDNAIGQKGRTLKCARCGEKWFQHPISAADEFGLDDTAPPPPPPAPPPPPPPPPPPDMDDDLDFDAPSIAIDLDDQAPLPSSVEAQRPKSTAKAAAKMAKSAKKKKTGSTTGLWILLLLFILIGMAGGIYVLQDTVIKYVPAAEDYLIMAKLRHERPGAGFELKRLGEIERGVHDNVEVVVIRGIIINVSDRSRIVPPLKLVLLDKDGVSLQEKITNPPVTSLDPAGTSSFKIVLERPDANARTINLEFVELPDAPPPAEETPKEDAAAPHAGLITPPPPLPTVAEPPPVAAPAAAPAPEPAAAHKKK